MQNQIKNYIPETALDIVASLLDEEHLVVKIKNERKTRHGDYRQLPNGKHQITVNSNLNKYRFLITLVHEIAHLEAYKRFGKFIKPHGKEWKQTFQYLMLPFLNPEIFPNELLPLLAEHFKNPKASSDTDSQLALALKQFDAPNDKTYVFEVPLGVTFKLYNGRIFKKGQKRRKRFECIEVNSGKLYLFNPNAEVELLKQQLHSLEEGNIT
ncbi:SprT-like domain-containing protein [Winogradskyella immobilis]|uniref:SprT-like domain-containing protein n=1 Tax=Winogradskyella immobilis TaxID=2816852 RepID=A0ABS8ENE1_9FLAO|nr:SprT-like domain-containing protein [Winogradskyella immobilis]MCC1484749.1 SprT-like domain-containing protein [Winogradskyella immobilis]MCG0016841.1 SprT-like domain-containing protein [Winogradskyella immobilis]